jgi:hypothetical protein
MHKLKGCLSLPAVHVVGKALLAVGMAAMPMVQLFLVTFTLCM